MAAILDPKTRFFDMYVTSEGRRQLSNGELRMRFVSFSDGYTSYEESEPGVIDRKDGEIFFEAMSRPQDSLISENPSIVNMLEVRNPNAQPAFLSNTAQVLADDDGLDNDNDGTVDEQGEMKTITLSNASIFGEELFVPPTGFVTQSISTAGIGNAKIDYDVTKDFYISGSDSQELFYDASDNGVSGFWIFDRSVGQPVSGIAGEPSNFLTVLDKVSQNLSSSSYFGTNASYMTYNGMHRNDSTPDISDLVVLKTVAVDKDNQKSYLSTSSNYIRISLDEYMYGRTFENPSSQTGRMVVRRPQTTPNPNLNTTSTVSSNLGHYESAEWVVQPGPDFNYKRELDVRYSDHRNLETPATYRWVNQFSIWFYIKEAAFDSGNVQTIASFYATTRDNDPALGRVRAKVYTIQNQLFLNLYDRVGNIYSHPGYAEPVPDFTLQYGVSNTAGPIEPEKWHRVSFVYGTPYIVSGEDRGNIDEGNSVCYLVLDGKLSNTGIATPTRIVPGYASNLLNISTVILGNFFERADGTPGSLADPPDPNNNKPQFLDGYIQSCEYYITPAKRLEMARYPGRRVFGVDEPNVSTTVPAYGQNDILEEYTEFLTRKNACDFTGQSPSLDANGEHIVDFSIRFRNEIVMINDQALHIEESLRRWIHYAPIPAEAAAYFSGYYGNSYVTETQLDRGLKRAELDEIVPLVENAMSGTMLAYNELKLLCHKDVSGRENRDLLVRRYETSLSEGHLEKIEGGFSASDTRNFVTRIPEVPDRELVYGQLPDDYFSPGLDSRLVSPSGGFESKVTGKVFLKEATVYNMEEVLDNELDEDDTTVSSSRVPNFFFLPPIGAKEYFQFEGKELEEGSETIRNAMSFRNFLKRRATETSADLQSILTSGNLELTNDANLATTLSTYKELMSAYYLNLIPRDFTDSVLKTLHLENRERFSDSNSEMIKYLLRNINDGEFGNSNFVTLEKFSEIIEFTETSEFNNSFIQMFEVCSDEGKAKFSKLAIRDLGIIRKSALTHPSNNESSGAERYSKNLVQSPKFSEGNKSVQLQEIYCHVFVFGKIINRKEDGPGTSIYFTPIFSLELEIGGE